MVNNIAVLLIVGIMLFVAFFFGCISGANLESMAASREACAEQCTPLPHAFVDGACGCVEVMDE
jgi:hypothetical protein